MAIKFVIDTSAYSRYFRGDAEFLIPYFKNSNQILIPTIVIGELRSGFAVDNKMEYNQHNLNKFLDASNVNIVSLTNHTTEGYAKIYAALKRAGTPIGTNDMWIAALALEHGIQLLTLDSDFSYVPNLKIAKI